jgi:hypothetical protein
MSDHERAVVDPIQPSTSTAQGWRAKPAMMVWSYRPRVRYYVAPAAIRRLKRHADDPFAGFAGKISGGQAVIVAIAVHPDDRRISGSA